MPFSTEIKTLGLKKEGVRGTAEVDIQRYIAVDKATEFEYKQTPIEDEQLRGIYERFSPQAGIKEGSGKITGVDVENENCGDLFLSLLGNLSSEKQGAEDIWIHTFKRHATLTQLPSYTFFMARGISAKAYPLSVVKSISFAGSRDGKLKADCDILFKTEEDTAASFAPSWTDAVPFMFYQTEIKIADATSLDVRSWTLMLDNQAQAYRTLVQSQDLRDVISVGKLLVSGTFETYFETEDERDKFLANTATSLEFILTGDNIGDSDLKRRLQFILPRVHYTAYPYQDMDGFLGAAVAFNCYYKPTGAVESARILLTNTIETY